uniref:probable ubiquitin-like-specific protease 2B isoform X2 n=1 Tax=Erigeron canadensis TaxID=72917 RepID=UPI001CB9CC05|nr:probable ubiquitin-like-specific protease 2B isoform X2 [Erigeron canadensis]
MHIYTRRKMKAVCNNNSKKSNLDVFDFKDEATDFGIRIQSNNAIDKYTFLATAASGKAVSAEEIKYVPVLDIDALDINHVSTTLLEDAPDRIVAGSKKAVVVTEHPSESSPELGTFSESAVSAPADAVVNVAVTSASCSNVKSNSLVVDSLPSLPEHDEAGEMDPCENGSVSERSPSSCGEADSDGTGPSSDHCIDEWEPESEDMATVVFYPDYLTYGTSYYTDSMISFTSDSIEMEGSTGDGDDDTVKCKWSINDILHIRSHWYSQLELVKIHVITKDKLEAEIVEFSSGTELKFAVPGPGWHERFEEIASLNVMYKALWSSMFEPEDAVIRHSGVSSSTSLPKFDPPFEEVVYPKGDADAVVLSKRDFDLLQPDTFVNDTIIDFYIKYLKNKIKPEERHRYHFFNSFFFRKLADPDKDQLDASQGKAAYQRVKKWTRKVNLFEKDYIFIPVNYNYHWSLIVICHLCEVATHEGEDANESIRVPCVLHMDSLRGSHSGLKGLVQSYLREECIGRQQVASEDVCSKFDNLRFISLELPQQPNLYDCGLFLLHYVELFLEQAPLHFSPFKIINSSNFLNVDWFSPAEASLKRTVIQRLICELLENPYHESSSAAGNEERCYLSFSTTNVYKDCVVNLSPERCKQSTPHQNSHVAHEIGISLTPSSSVQCVDDPTMTSKLSFQSGLFLDTPFQGFNDATTFEELKGSEEVVEGDVQFVYTQTESGIQQANGIIPEDLYSSQDFKTLEPWQVPGINLETLPEASTSVCEDSPELVKESQLDSEIFLRQNIDKTRSPIHNTLSEHVHMVDVNEGDDPRFPDSQGTSPTDSVTSPRLKSDLQNPTKKMRMECEAL